MTQRICILSQGAGCKMYTLWNHNMGSAYVKPEYIKNLSTDYDTALIIAEQWSEQTGRELVNDAMESLRAIFRSKSMTATMVKFGKNKGTELRDCEPKFIVWIAKGCPLFNEENQSWDNHVFGGSDFQVYAQELATELGLGLMHNSRFYTNDQYAKQMEREQLMSQLQNGHHYTAGQRLDLTLTCIKNTGYDSQYGYVWVYTFMDADKKVYTYKGHALYDYPSGIPIQKDSTITCKATIKHSAYKDEPVTYIQRLKFA